MTVLVVNPNNRIISPFAGVEPPLWAGLMASDLAKRGREVMILDAEALDLSVEETVEQIKTIKPEEMIIVVMGNNPSASSTPKMVATKKLIDLLGVDNISVTGLHPLALPEETEEDLGVPVLRDRFEGMPFMPWELLPMDRYVAHNWHCLDGSPRQPYASIYTSLGCPFDCEFCNIHALYGGQHKVWFRNPDDVIAELDVLVSRYKVRNIKFWDELFTLNKSHVNDICDRLIDRGYDLNIWAYARVDTINHDMLLKMRMAGITWLAYGFESGSDKVLQTSNKRASRDQAIRAVTMTQDAGINVMGNFIFGLVGDNIDTMKQTLDFAKELKVDYVNFYAAKAYPGSKLYNGGSDWGGYEQYALSKGEIDEFRDYAFNDFFTDKGYLYRIKHRFGEQVIKHIDGMLKYGKPKTRSN